MAVPALNRERAAGAARNVRLAPRAPAAAAAGANRFRQHALRILVLWILISAAYSNSFQAGLVFDNTGVIGEDPRIREASAQNIHSIWTGGYWYVNSTSGLYRPLTTTSYLFNHAVLGNGIRPAGYHWFNLSVHAINVALVYALGALIFGNANSGAALAALWGLHPLLTESVTNIVGRADLLAAFGVLAGLLCHIRSGVASGRRRLAWLMGLLAAQAAGLISKESAAVLPGVMLLYDMAFPTGWRRRVAGYAAIALPFAGFFYLRTLTGAHMIVDRMENPLAAAGFWTARFTAIKVIGKFLWKFVWPARLSADYSYNAVPLFSARGPSWENAQSMVALACCAGAVLLAVHSRRKRPPLFFFMLLFFVALAPASNLVFLIGSIMAERFLYLPSLGLAGCVVGLVYTNWRQKWSRAGIAVLCLAFAARTYARNFDWRDDLSLWTSTVEVSPGSAKAHYNLGVALARIPGRLPEAISQYREALRIQPGHASAHYNLGNALAQTPGQETAASAEYQAALRADPDLAEAHFSLGKALSHIPGRLPEAVAEYRAALRIRSDYADAHTNLGIALAQIPGRLPEAVTEFEAALRLHPGSADAHNNLGNTLAAVPGRLPEAIAEFQAALRIDPAHASARMNLADALAQESLAARQNR
jgi:Flp pilus assembly protein TadD